MTIDASMYDDPNLLVGGIERDTSVFQTSKTIEKIFDCPTTYGDTSWQQWQKCNVLDWWSEWKKLKDLSRLDYIYLVGCLPTLLAQAGLVPIQSQKTWHFQQIKNLYKGIALWVEFLTDYEDLTPRPSICWDWCLSDGYKAKARWDLAKAVITFNGNRFSSGFSPSAHLWFWSEIGYCLRTLKASGLFEPLLHSEIPTKKEVLKTWSELIENLEQRGQCSFEMVQNLKEAISTIDRQVLAKALEGRYLESIEDSKGDPLESYIEIERWARDSAKNSKSASVTVSYCFPKSPQKSPQVLTYQGKKHVKLPRKKKRGFIK